MQANGSISTLAVFPARPGRTTDSAPTSVAVGPDGAYYVGELTGVPFNINDANIYRVVPGQPGAVILLLWLNPIAAQKPLPVSAPF